MFKAEDWTAVKFDLMNMLADTANTPDLAKLEQKLEHLLFVPCALKRGEAEHEKLRVLEYKGFAYTHSKFLFYKFKDDLSPFAIRNSDAIYFNAEYAPLSGEVFEVPTEGILELDKLRENGLKFNRRWVKLLVPFKYRFKNTDHFDPNKFGFKM